jgi:nitrogen regulatory protein P-II 1
VVDEEVLDPVVRELKRLAWTGASGAGKIFVIPVEEAVRVSTDEAGPLAIY